MSWKVALGLVVVGGLVATTFAEIPTQPKKDAAYVVTGQVKKIYERDGRAHREYLIEIRVDEVERGQDLQNGDTIYVHAFMRRPGDTVTEPGAAGHRAIPEEGQQIKAWTKGKRDRMTALYPRWFDVLSAPAEAKAARSN